MRIPMLLALLLVASLGAVSCFSSGGDSDPDPEEQTLQLSEYPTGNSEIVLELYGPKSATGSPISYFVFGSHENLGTRTIVPLQAQRLDEQAVATLAFGESQLGIDLSDWDAYEYVYLRANPCQPQIIIMLEPGTRYVFSST